MPNPGEVSQVSPPQKSGEEKNAPTSHGKAWAVAIFVVVVIAGVWWRNHGTKADNKTGASARGEAPAVPVVAGVVARKDVPIYLEGLGTVQAFNTVTIHSRVDGQLIKVNFVEGQEVHTGDLLAQIDPDPFKAQLQQNIAKKGQDEAQLANAKVDLKRYADLLANEGVTQQVYDTQKALVNQLEATVKADEAAIESAKVQLNYTTITSPIDGRTGIRLVDQGNIIKASDANGLVVITQLKPISVVFALPQQNLGKIQAQESISGLELPVIALGQDNTNILANGQLAVIDNQIDTTTGTIKLKATFPNADMKLWPGQFVTARLQLTTRKDSAVVPSSVVQRGPEGSFAFVIKEDQTVEVRAVKVAQIEQGEALIEEGLTPGERVVEDGQFKLQNGSRIKTADSPDAGKGSGHPTKKANL